MKIVILEKKRLLWRPNFEKQNKKFISDFDIKGMVLQFQDHSISSFCVMYGTKRHTQTNEIILNKKSHKGVHAFKILQKITITT